VATERVGSTSDADIRRLSEKLFSFLDESSKKILIVEVAGDPGTGKTKLLNDLRAAATKRERHVLHVRCKESRQSSPLLVFTGMEGKEPDTILRPPPQGSASSSWTVDGFYDAALVHHATRMLVGSGAPADLVVLLDDFHWADSSSVEFVDRLVQWPANASLLLVIAHRPRQSPSASRSVLAHGVEMGKVKRIVLKPLEIDESARLLGMAADDPHLAELHERAGGVPLYLLALASWPDVPEPQAALLTGEVAPLPAAQTAVIAAAAVLDGGGDLDALAAVAALPAAEAQQAIDDLVRRDLLRTADESRRTFTARHPVLRDVVYASADPDWRWQAHRRAYAVLADRGGAAVDQARHVERALVGLNDADLDVLVHAAAEAMRTSPSASAHWLRVALSVFPESRRDDRRRMVLALHLARCHWISGRLMESRDLLHEILRLAPDDAHELREPAARLCGMVEWMLGHYAEAHAVLNADLPAPHEAAALTATASGTLNGYVTLPNLGSMAATEGRDRVAEAARIALEGVRQVNTGSVEQAHETLRRAAMSFDRLSDAELAAYPEYLGILSRAETLIGKLTDTQRHFARSIRIVREHGCAGILPTLLLGRSIACLNTGPVREAVRLAADAAAAARDIGAEHVRCVAQAIEAVATVWTEHRNLPRALALAKGAAELLRPGGDHFGQLASVALALAVYFSGDPKRCISLIVEAGGGRDLHQISVFLQPTCFEMIAAASADTGQVTPEWAVRAEAAQTGGLPHQKAYVLSARAHFLRATKDYRGAAELYEQAAALFGESGSVRAQAWTLAVAAGPAATAGRHDDAAMMLAMARELANRCGSGRVLEKAREQEREINAVRCRSAEWDDVTVLSALTGREREIAVIAGSGMKTRDIARKLSLSPRTVDVHLTRIYRKLNVPSRAALARLMARINSRTTL
jgi:DNA-binding CsgD family transcriptional regulator/tetratricopeptide (TPR) repeat protein